MFPPHQTCCGTKYNSWLTEYEYFKGRIFVMHVDLRSDLGVKVRLNLEISKKKALQSLQYFEKEMFV
jgi:hypothetical protein